MSVLMKVYQYLVQIKEGEVTFQNLINKGFKDFSQEESFLIRDSLKSIVNRYYFLLWEQSKLIPLEKNELKDYFVCALGQYHYVREIDEERLLAYFNEDLSFLNPDVSPADLYQAIVKLGGSPLPISERENEILTKRLSVNYAYPEWVVKMMGKHFGIKHAYKAIASSRKSIQLALNCNIFLTNRDRLLESGLFEKGKLASNTLRYSGKEKLIDLDAFHKNLIFVEDEASQMLVEKLNLEPGDEALLIADDRGTVALDMAMRMRDVGCIHVAAANIFNYNSSRSIANRFKIHSMDLFQSGMDEMLTHVPESSCDKVFLIAESSSLGLVRRKPAVLLTLKRDQLDAIISKQKSDLEEASLFVKPDGMLLYAVFTYDRKESYAVIEDFLTRHSEFELLEEKQIFSYEAPSDGVYYACMKKRGL